MSVSTTSRKVSYSGNNSTSTEYAIPFAFLDTDHISVWVTPSGEDGADLDAGDFTVTKEDDNSGGAVTTDPAIPATSEVVIYRQTAKTQPATLEVNGPLPSETLETSLDRHVLQHQDLEEVVDRLNLLDVDATDTEVATLKTRLVRSDADLAEDLAVAADPALDSRVAVVESGKLDLAGGTMTGDVDLDSNEVQNATLDTATLGTDMAAGSNRITGLANGPAGNDAVNKQQLDTARGLAAVNAETATARVLRAADDFSRLRFTATATVTFPMDGLKRVEIENAGAGVVSVVPSHGVTLNGLGTEIVAGGVGLVQRIAEGEYTLSGDIQAATDYNAIKAMFKLRASETGALEDAGGDPPADAEEVELWKDTSSLFAAGRDVANRKPTYVSADVAVQFDGAADPNADGIGQLDTAVLHAAHTMPDRTGVTGKGFTCTGVCTDGDGGFWVVNYGYDDPSDTTQSAELVNLASDAQTVLSAITLADVDAAIDRVQGVTLDTSDGSLWVVSYDNSTIYNITTAGALVTSYNSTDDGFNANPNGIAYDASDDTLIVLHGATGAVVRIECSDGTLNETLPSLAGAGIDNVAHLDLVSGVLVATHGANGADININTLWLGGGDNAWRRGSHMAADADSGEGILAQGARVVVAHDGWYHNSDSPVPALNQLRDFDSGMLIGEHGRVVIMAVFKLTSSSGTGRCLFALGDPVNEVGVGLYVDSGSVTDLSLYANTADGTSEREILGATAADLSASYTLIQGDIDLATGELKLYQDGTQIGSTLTTTVAQSTVYSPTPSIGDNLIDSANRALPVRIKDLIVLGDPTDAEVTSAQSLLAAEHSITLP